METDEESKKEQEQEKEKLEIRVACQEMVGTIFGKDRHHFKRGCSLDSQTDDHTTKILGLVDSTISSTILPI